MICFAVKHTLCRQGRELEDIIGKGCLSTQSGNICLDICGNICGLLISQNKAVFYRYNFSIATCWRNLSFKVLSWKIFPASCVGGSHCETCKCLMFPCKRANTKNTLFNLTRICLLSLFQQGLIKLSRFWKGTNMTWNLSLLSAYIAKYLFLQCYLSILGQIDRPQVHSFTSEGTNKSPYEFSRKSGFNGIFNSLKYLSLKFPNFRRGSIWMKAEVAD